MGLTDFVTNSSTAHSNSSPMVSIAIIGCFSLIGMGIGTLAVAIANALQSTHAALSSVAFLGCGAGLITGIAVVARNYSNRQDPAAIVDSDSEIHFSLWD